MREPTQQRDGEGRRRRLQGSDIDPACGPAGVVATACLHREIDATRETPGGGCVTQPDAREGQAGPSGESERSVVPSKPGNAGGGKGPQFKVNVRSGESREIGDEPTTSTKRFRSYRRRCMPKRRDRPSYRFYALYDKVYREDVLGYAYELLPGQRRRSGSGRPDVRGHRGVRRGDSGWTNWRRNSGRRRIVRRPSGGCGFPSRTASSGRWAFRRSGIVWCRWRRCWSWNRSSRPTCSRSNMPTARDAVRWTPFKQVHALLNTGHTEVVDADLSGYFDSIPHAELMKSVARRISDRHAAASDQDVAGNAGGRDRRAGTQAANDPQQGRGPGHAARGAALAAVGQSVHASVHPGLEGAGTRARVSTLTSSTMPTTS